MSAAGFSCSSLLEIGGNSWATKALLSTKLCNGTSKGFISIIEEKNPLTHPLQHKSSIVHPTRFLYNAHRYLYA